MGDNMRNLPRVWEATREVTSPVFKSDSGEKKGRISE
jgi:hypothetical protein